MPHTKPKQRDKNYLSSLSAIGAL